MTVELKLGEVLVHAAVEKLRAGMPARIAAINAARADETVMAAPGDDAYFSGRVRDFPDTPAIFVMEGPGKFDKEGTHGLIFKPDLLVYIAESDADGPLLAKRLQRQVKAVIETLWDDDPVERLEGSAYHITPLRTIPGTVFEPTASNVNWRAFYTVVFRAEQLET